MKTGDGGIPTPKDFGAVVGYDKSWPDPDVAQLDLKLEQRHCNCLGTIHGGVILTMLDAAGMWACTDGGSTGVCATVSISCSFLRAVTLEKCSELQARGQVTRKSQRLYFVNITARAGDETIATAQGVYARPSENGTRGTALG